MDKWINAPFTLRIKVVITLLTGIGSLILAAILFPVSHDRILIILSGMIFGFCLCRSIDILLLILRGSYEAITGTCTAVSPQPLRRYRKIALVDTHGAEIILLLGKQLKIKPGNCSASIFGKPLFHALAVNIWMPLWPQTCSLDIIPVCLIKMWKKNRFLQNSCVVSPVLL